MPPVRRNFKRAIKKIKKLTDLRNIKRITAIQSKKQGTIQLQTDVGLHKICVASLTIIFPDAYRQRQG
jgi:hypothetical protein